MFPDLSNYFGECNVIITKRKDGQTCEYKTQVAISLNYSFAFAPVYRNNSHEHVEDDVNSLKTGPLCVRTHTHTHTHTHTLTCSHQM